MNIIDVRTVEEYEGQHIPHAINIPLGDLQNMTPYATKKLQHIGHNEELLVHCASGGRSAVACILLTQLGYTSVKNVGGYEEACSCI